MFAVYEVLNANQAVRDLLFDGKRLRVWGYGYAPQDELGQNPIIDPYVTFQIPVDVPENAITCHATISDQVYQFDVYARDGAKASQISKALQLALRAHGFIETIRHPTFEPDTKIYAGGFDFSYIETE